MKCCRTFGYNKTIEQGYEGFFCSRKLKNDYLLVYNTTYCKLTFFRPLAPAPERMASSRASRVCSGFPADSSATRWVGGAATGGGGGVGAAKAGGGGGAAAGAGADDV